MNGIELIAAERKRQIEVEGWTPEHDDQWKRGELALAAYAYVLPEDERPGVTDSQGKFTPSGWPWAQSWWKPTPDDRIRELVKAGALIVAEIERLQRTK
jgi:hypothetical protein